MSQPLKNIFFCKVLSYEPDEHKYYTDCAFGYADSLSEAAEVIDSYYKSTFVSILELRMLEEPGLVFVPENFKHTYFAADFPAVDFSIETDASGNKIKEGDE